MVRTDKNYNGTMATAGGVAIFVPQDWSCLEVDIRPLGNHCESLTVVITPSGESATAFILNTMYNHPGNHISPQFISDLKNYRCNGQRLPLMITGDLNSPHTAFGSRTINEYGSSLFQIINNENLIVINNDKEPTYYSNATGLENILDLVIVDSEMNKLIADCSVRGDIGSDHLPVVTTLNQKIRYKLRELVNMKQWAITIDKKISCYTATENIDENIETISRLFQEAKSESTFIGKSFRRNLPLEIRQFINLRRSLLKSKKKATTDLAKKVITRQYNRINHIVQRKLKEYDDRALEKLASDVCQTDDLGKMWKLFNRYKNGEEEISKPETPLMRPCGNLTVNAKEKCDEFSRHMNSVHQTPENPMFDIDFKRQLDSSMDKQRNKATETSINPIQVAKLRELLASTKSGSSPGEDSVSYDILKLCSDTSLQAICNIFNQCLNDNIFPVAWKSAKLRMILKPGKDPTQASGYRPISLISCMGKLLEKYINISLMKELNEKKFFKPVQAGYTKGRSSQEHLFRLSQDVMNGFKSRKCTAGLFLDVKAAFDCVWLNGLKSKIQKIGLSKQLENILFSFLENRTLRIFENGTWSEIVYLGAGTPQGSILSPILYLIYMNDATDGLNTDQLCVSQYADDIGTWTTGDTVKEIMQNMQRGVNQLEKWCHKWFVTLNPLKSQLVVFTKCLRHKEEMKETNFTIKLFGHSIQIVPEVVFLGVIFDQRMTWEPQYRNTVSRAHKRLNLLRRICSLAKDPNPNILAKLYQSLIIPIFEYSSICSISAAECHIEKLQLVQNMALRVVMKSPKYITIHDLHDCTGFVTIKDHLVSYAKQRVKTMRKNSNILEKSIEQYNRVKHILENQSPMDVIF